MDVPSSTLAGRAGTRITVVPSTMLSSSLILAGLLFPSLAWGTPMARMMQVQESRESAPSGYTLTGPADPDTVLTLKLALTQNDSDGLIDALYNVSTPPSAKYGQYLTAQEVCTMSRDSVYLDK